MDKMYKIIPEQNYPLVSVILPVFNGGNYLYEAIKSIIDQKYRNIEFIIINDGSTDSSEDIIHKFKDDRIRYFKNERNYGLIYSLNRGINKSHGSYIARMDQDDISLNNRLQIQVDYMENNPDVVVCGTWIKYFGNSPGIIIPYSVNHEEIICDMLFYNPIAHPTVIIRKNMLDLNNIRYGEYNSAEDYELWYRFGKIGRLHNIPKVLLKYRISPTSITHSKIKELSGTVENIYTQQLNKLLIHPSKKDIFIHKNIGNMKIIENYDDLLSTEKHLTKLFNINNRLHYYPKKEFDGLLNYLWFKVCLSYRDKSWKIIKLYFSNPLALNITFNVSLAYKTVLYFINISIRYIWLVKNEKSKNSAFS